MTQAATTYQHIVLDEHGTPIIGDTNTKVIEVVLQIRSSGISPEQLHLEMPHLGLGQIHSALAYYWDHKTALDTDIARRKELVERLRRENGQPPIVDRLRAQHGG